MNNVMFKAFLNVFPVSYTHQLVYTIDLPRHVKRCYLRVAEKLYWGIHYSESQDPRSTTIFPFTTVLIGWVGNKFNINELRWDIKTETGSLPNRKRAEGWNKFLFNFKGSIENLSKLIITCDDQISQLTYGRLQQTSEIARDRDRAFHNRYFQLTRRIQR